VQVENAAAHGGANEPVGQLRMVQHPNAHGHEGILVGVQPDLHIAQFGTYEYLKFIYGILCHFLCHAIPSHFIPFAQVAFCEFPKLN
jgi:hypothetical protein